MTKQSKWISGDKAAKLEVLFHPRLHVLGLFKLESKMRKSGSRYFVRIPLRTRGIDHVRDLKS
jgi:hypothetical protein